MKQKYLKYLYIQLKNKILEKNITNDEKHNNSKDIYNNKYNSLHYKSVVCFK